MGMGTAEVRVGFGKRLTLHEIKHHWSRANSGASAHNRQRFAECFGGIRRPIHPDIACIEYSAENRPHGGCLYDLALPGDMQFSDGSDGLCQGMNG